jgi:hypothetical protein
VLGVTYVFNFEDIKERSESSDKLIVCYIDAMELLYIYEQESTHKERRLWLDKENPIGGE